MDWQCTYWLFPEGSYVALEGFALSQTAGYLGGPQKLSIWHSANGFTQLHVPDWERPWWLHQTAEVGFVAAHLFYATPLTIGFGNNPFTVNAEGQDRDPRIEFEGNRLALRWSHRVDDPAILRLMTQVAVPHRSNEPQPDGQAKPASWEPGVDWFYRQYLVAVGDKAGLAESALREVLGAAAGWIDRPVGEEEVASLLVRMMEKPGDLKTAEIDQLPIVPAVLAGDDSAVRDLLAHTRSPAERTDYYIRLIQRHVQRGGKPAEGRRKPDPDGTEREGWTGNPAHHASQMPCYIRVLEYFDLPFPA